MDVEFLDKSLYFMTIKTATGGISISSDVSILSKHRYSDRMSVVLSSVEFFIRKTPIFFVKQKSETF